MNKLFKIILPLLMFFGNIQYSSAIDLCVPEGVAFMFFNGVQTTPLQATAATEEFKRLHGATTSDGETIKYETMYNSSGGFEDFVETFEQRLLEQGGLLQGRYELFFQALNGEGPWWSRIINSVGEAFGILQGLVDWFQAAAIEKLTSLLGNPPTTVNYAEHRLRLDNRILEGKKMLLVAHSQGNLFVNAAYNYVISKNVLPESVKVVHIAPASPTLSGNHVLADKDLVINGLRIVGSVPSITDSIPGYLLRPQGINGKKDILGHGLIEIYINQSLNISQRVTSHIDNALTTLIAPPQNATTGFFSATLTWNGSGDVDLHTFEPDGSHVYYANSQGTTGFLDFDNVVANGPEHYFASCESNELQTGSYKISVANFDRANGRIATIQISSVLGGVLGTKSVTLGSFTRDIPSATLFNVIVTHDSQTDEYSVSLTP